MGLPAQRDSTAGKTNPVAELFLPIVTILSRYLLGKF